MFPYTSVMFPLTSIETVLFPNGKLSGDNVVLWLLIVLGGPIHEQAQAKIFSHEN